ncbi:MAG: preprotein translocase subunit SecE [Clostridia bacterium]
MAKVTKNAKAKTFEPKLDKKAVAKMAEPKIEKVEKKAKVKKSEPKVKRHRTKEIFSELKKVNWPTFGKTMKQTGMVISIVVIFMLLVLGIDSLVGFLIKLIVG